GPGRSTVASPDHARSARRIVGGPRASGWPVRLRAARRPRGRGALAVRGWGRLRSPVPPAVTVQGDTGRDKGARSAGPPGHASGGGDEARSGREGDSGGIREEKRYPSRSTPLITLARRSQSEAIGLLLHLEARGPPTRRQLATHR